MKQTVILYDSFKLVGLNEDKKIAMWINWCAGKRNMISDKVHRIT